MSERSGEGRDVDAVEDGIWAQVQELEDRYQSGAIGREELLAGLEGLWATTVSGGGAAAVFRGVLSETRAAVGRRIGGETYLERVRAIWLHWLLSGEDGDR